MTKKQTLTIALLCAVAALLAALMLWRPGAPAPAGRDAHAQHQDTHGHDDRHAEGSALAPASAGRAVTMSDAQIKANGIALDAARPAPLHALLHLPAQVKVDAERSVALAAPASGIVRSVLVAQGAAVRQGQPLVTLHSPAVAQWRAEAAAARARLALARTTHAREKMLWEEKISARQDLDAATTALAEARIAYDAARARLQAFGIDTDGAVSGIVTVRAPLAGIVVDKPAVAGQAVDETRPLLTVADLAHVWIEAAVPADSLGQVSTGMQARVSAGALTDALAGTVAFVGPTLGETTRMATARIALPNAGLRLRPGMLASVDLLGAQTQAPVTVANDALQTLHERSIVFVRTAQGFEARDVVTGRTDGKRTEIVSGLAAGSVCASAGSFLLKADLGKNDAGHDD